MLSVPVTFALGRLTIEQLYLVAFTGEGENDQGAGIALIGVALVVMIINLFLRLGVSSTRDREREEAAREHFDRTGRWPDEG